MRFRALRRQAWRLATQPRRWSIPRTAPATGGFVYVMEGEAGAHKIGSSNDPERRRRELQTGTPFDLRIRHTVAVAGDPAAVEHAAHELLDRHRINREWFAVPADLAVGAIYAAAYRLGALGRSVDAERREGGTMPGLASGAAVAIPFCLLASNGRPLGAVAYVSACLAAGTTWFLLREPRIRRLRWIGVGALATVGIAIAIPARAVEPIPAIDGSRYCASISGFVNDNAVIKKGCLDNEAKAERHVRALWDETPASVRSQCLKTIALVTPSYQGLSGCMSLAIGTMWLNGDVKITPR